MHASIYICTYMYACLHVCTYVCMHIDGDISDICICGVGLVFSSTSTQDTLTNILQGALYRYTNSLIRINQASRRSVWPYATHVSYVYTPRHRHITYKESTCACTVTWACVYIYIYTHTYIYGHVCIYAHKHPPTHLNKSTSVLLCPFTHTHTAQASTRRSFTMVCGTSMRMSPPACVCRFAYVLVCAGDICLQFLLCVLH